MPISLTVMEHDQHCCTQQTMQHRSPGNVIRIATRSGVNTDQDHTCEPRASEPVPAMMILLHVGRYFRWAWKAAARFDAHRDPEQSCLPRLDSTDTSSFALSLAGIDPHHIPHAFTMQFPYTRCVPPCTILLRDQMALRLYR